MVAQVPSLYYLSVNFLRFEHIKELYRDDQDFEMVYVNCFFTLKAQIN